MNCSIVETLHTFYNDIMCKDLPGFPSTFLSDGSKVIRGIIVWKEGEPGDEAKGNPSLRLGDTHVCTF